MCSGRNLSRVMPSSIFTNRRLTPFCSIISLPSQIPLSQLSLSEDDSVTTLIFATSSISHSLYQTKIAFRKSFSKQWFCESFSLTAIPVFQRTCFAPGSGIEPLTSRDAFGADPALLGFTSYASLPTCRQGPISCPFRGVAGLSRLSNLLNSTLSKHTVSHRPTLLNAVIELIKLRSRAGLEPVMTKTYDFRQKRLFVPTRF